MIRLTQYTTLICMGGSTYIFTDNTLLNPFVLETCLQRHGVHAASAAVVPGSQPILLHTLQLRVSPREEVAIYWNITRNIISQILHSKTVHRLTPCRRVSFRG